MAENQKAMARRKRFWIIITGLLIILIGIILLATVLNTGSLVKDGTLLAPTLFVPPGVLP